AGGLAGSARGPRGAGTGLLAGGAGGGAPFVDQGGDEGRPARLVRGAQPGAVVAVEVLIEEDEVAPEGVVLERARAAVDRPSAGGVAREDPDQAVGDLAGQLVECGRPAAGGRGAHAERRPVRLAQLAERLDQQKAGREPDRAPPVRVAPLDLRLGLRRLV